MLALTEPLEITRTLEWGGATGDVTLWIREPEEEFFREFLAWVKSEPPDDAPLPPLFAPERLARYVERWAGVGAAGAETPCTPENVQRACGKRAFLTFLRDAVLQARSRAVEKNSEASPAGPTDEAQNGPPNAVGDAES